MTKNASNDSWSLPYHAELGLLLSPYLVGAFILVGLPALLLLNAQEGGWSLFWTLFGTSNQLLAALTLLGVTVWLRKTGRRTWFVFYPMVFVFGITFWSFLKQIGIASHQVLTEGLHFSVGILNGGVALLLLSLAGLIIFEAYRKAYREA